MYIYNFHNSFNFINPCELVSLGIDSKPMCYADGQKRSI